jgi:hypothetical protein
MVMSVQGRTFPMSLSERVSAASRSVNHLSHQTECKRVQCAVVPVASPKKSDSIAIMQTRDGDGLHTAAVWRAKADETRALGEQLTNADAKSTMESIAKMYDELAEREADREERDAPLSKRSSPPANRTD